jgi:DNA-binding transcriptional LysR family regulator
VQIESRQLRQLVMLAKSGSFSAAARRLSLTEPALLRNVQTLERGLGLRLFQRRRGGVSLTPAGEILVGRAQKVVDGLDGLRRDVAQADTARRATLRIGAGVIPRIRVLPIALARFVRAHPRVQTEVLDGTVGGFLRALLRGEIDAFVGDFAEAARARLTVADLAAYPLALPTLPRNARSLLDAIERRAWIRCDDVVTIRKLALEDLAVGLEPVSFVVDDLASGALRELDVEGGAFSAEIGIVLRLGSRTLGPLAALVDALHAADFGDVPVSSRRRAR